MTKGSLCCWLFVLSTATFAASLADMDIAEAAKNQNTDIVHALLARHVNVNAPQGDGSTALHWAAHWNDLDTAGLLLTAGANINAVNDLGVAPIYLACANGNAAMAEKLLEAGANPNLVAATGVSPLMMAARSGNAEAVEALLAHGANPNAKGNTGGQTALMWAVAQQHPDVVRLLVAHGAYVNARSASYGTLVYTTGAKEEFFRLAPGRYFPNLVKTVPVGGSTALLFAARQGCIECARFLLDGGANVNDTAPDGNSALVLAAHSGEGRLAAFLLDQGANPDSSGAGYTALHVAVLRDDLELVKALLSHGANPNVRLETGTPHRRNGPDFSLHAALIGATPFLLAAKYASVGMMRVLADGGADLKLTTEDGTTPLIAAAGAVQRIFDDLNNYPYAEADHILEAVRLTIRLGGDVNAFNQAGDTALHIAATRGQNQVVQLLVDNGAKLNLKNKLGQTPLALSRADCGVRSAHCAGPPPSRSTDLLRKLGAAE